MAIKTLEKCAIFKGVETSFLQSVFGNSQSLLKIKKGDYVFRQGDKGDGMYIVTKGQLSVISEGRKDTVIATIEEGSFFGEVSLLTSLKRTASIKANQDSSLLFINAKEFRQYIKENDINTLRISHNISIALAHRLEKAGKLIQAFQVEAKSEVATSEIADYKRRLLSEVLI